jgi:signal transduction histidine kinase
MIRNDIIRDNSILIVTMFLLMVTVMITFIIKQYRKIRKIDQYLYKVLNNNYSLDIREYEEGDISNLKNDIYKVTVRLKNMNENSLEEKKYLENILSDISHQIKTPLTSMYVINDLLMKDDMDNKIRKDFLNKNRFQLERIEWLVTSLLKMSRLDSGSVKLNKKEVNVLDLIKTSLEPIQIPIELKEIKLVIDIPSDITYIGDFKWSSEALINILKNAYEHTPKGGQIDIKATTNVLYTEIIVTDNGEGIDKKDLPLVFKRFYKGSSNKESIGIGLNMAKMIIERQNGIIEVDSVKGKYTTFRVRLYKKDI